MPFVRRIAKGAEVGVVRRRNEELAAGLEQPVQLLHGAHDIGDVLDHMDQPHLIERAVSERIRKMVEVADDVGFGALDSIDADCARVFVDPATYIEDP